MFPGQNVPGQNVPEAKIAPFLGAFRPETFCPGNILSGDILSGNILSWKHFVRVLQRPHPFETLENSGLLDLLGSEYRKILFIANSTSCVF